MTLEPGIYLQVTASGTILGPLVRAFGSWYRDGAIVEAGDVWSVIPAKVVPADAVVLDLTREQARDLKYALKLSIEAETDSHRERTGNVIAARMATAQIEAQVPPPKPVEPTGFGARVRDHDGVAWVRTTPGDKAAIGYPWLSEAGTRMAYADIDAVEVVR